MKHSKKLMKENLKSIKIKTLNYFIVDCLLKVIQSIKIFSFLINFSIIIFNITNPVMTEFKRIEKI